MHDKNVKCSFLAKIEWQNTLWLGLVHVAAIGCFFYYSWAAFWAGFAVLFIVTQGIAIGFHRLLAHRAFKTYPWLRRFFALLGTLSVQRSASDWVAIHRMHHAGSDTVNDPHSAGRGFWFSYMGWLIEKQPQFYNPKQIRHFSRDITNDWFIAFLSRNSVQFYIQFLMFGSLWVFAGPDFAFFCVPGRLLINYHATFLVNAACHKSGHRSYDTDDRSTNIRWLAYLTSGEGLHNNHHAEPDVAVNSRLPGDFDLSGQIILALEYLGLAWDVNLTKKPLYGNQAAEMEPAR